MAAAAACLHVHHPPVCCLPCSTPCSRRQQLCPRPVNPKAWCHNRRQHWTRGWHMGRHRGTLLPGRCRCLQVMAVSRTNVTGRDRAAAAPSQHGLTIWRVQTANWKDIELCAPAKCRVAQPTVHITNELHPAPCTFGLPSSPAHHPSHSCAPLLMTVPGCSPCSAMSRAKRVWTWKLVRRLSAPFFSQMPHRPLSVPRVPLVSWTLRICGKVGGGNGGFSKWTARVGLCRGWKPMVRLVLPDRTAVQLNLMPKVGCAEHVYAYFACRQNVHAALNWPLIRLTHRAEVGAVHSNAHVCVDDRHVIHPAVGGAPEVQLRGRWTRTQGGWGKPA